MKRLRRLLLMIAPLALVLAGCAGPNLSPTPPSGFDLSGEWRLVEDESEAEPGAPRFAENRRGARRQLARGGVGNDFPVVRARTLSIEQSVDSMGIRYDGGNYRDVTWGIRERGMWTVNAGWQDGQLHIISKAHDSEAVEIMQLSADGRTLVVDIEVEAGQKFALQRVFRRI